MMYRVECWQDEIEYFYYFWRLWNNIVSLLISNFNNIYTCFFFFIIIIFFFHPIQLNIKSDIKFLRSQRMYTIMLSQTNDSLDWTRSDVFQGTVRIKRMSGKRSIDSLTLHPFCGVKNRKAWLLLSRKWDRA